MGSGPWDPGPREPGTRNSGSPSKFKSVTQDPLKFKSATSRPLQNLKVGPQDPLQSLKVGPLQLFLMNSFFQNIFSPSLLIYFCAFFKQDTKKYQL